MKRRSKGFTLWCIGWMMIFCLQSTIAAPKWGGRIQLDSDYYDAYFREAGSDQPDNRDVRYWQAELRALKIGIKVRVHEAWTFKTKLALSAHDAASGLDAEVEIDDLYFRYEAGSDMEWTLGKGKEPFGLENQISSADLWAIERSMATSAFSPGRNLGISLAQVGEIQAYDWIGQLGLYQNSVEDSLQDETTLALTGRMAASRFWKKPYQGLHVGASFSIRDWGEGQYELESRAGVHTADKILDTRKITSDRVDLYSLEAAWVFNRFTVLGEWFTQQVQAQLETENVDYNGYYLQAGYFLTPASRKYKNGEFDQVTPEGDHAWEVVVRVDQLDGRNDQRGKVLNNGLLGVNYYWGKEYKFMLDAIRSRSTWLSSDRKDQGTAVSFRVQMQF